jgi:hypothetical protein
MLGRLQFGNRRERRSSSESPAHGGKVAYERVLSSIDEASRTQIHHRLMLRFREGALRRGAPAHHDRLRAAIYVIERVSTSGGANGRQDARNSEQSNQTGYS